MSMGDLMDIPGAGDLGPGIPIPPTEKSWEIKKIFTITHDVGTEGHFYNLGGTYEQRQALSLTDDRTPDGYTMVGYQVFFGGSPVIRSLGEKRQGRYGTGIVQDVFQTPIFPSLEDAKKELDTLKTKKIEPDKILEAATKDADGIKKALEAIVYANLPARNHCAAFALINASKLIAANPAKKTEIYQLLQQLEAVTKIPGYSQDSPWRELWWKTQ